MAFKLAQLFVAVGADTKQFDLGMVRVQGTVGKIKNQLNGLSIAAKRVFMVGAGLIAAMTSAAGSYEKSMARIRAITRISGDALKEFDKVIRNLGLSTIYSAKEVSDAARYLAIAGFKVDEIMTALPAVMDLAAAGMMDVAGAADYSAKIMRGMGIPANRLRLAVDMMSKAFTSANTDLHQFAEALSYVGPMARLSEYSLNEVGAALMVVSNAGIQAERAGTGVRRFLAELSRQASPTKDKLRKLGVATMDMGGNMRSIPDILRDMLDAMEKTIPKAQRMGLLMDIFGLRAGPAAGAMQLNIDKLRDFEVLLAKAGGTAAYVAKVQMNTLWGNLKRLKNALFEVGITFGTIFIPVIEGAAGAFRSAAIFLRELRNDQVQAIAATIFFATAISGLILTLKLLFGILSINPVILFITGLIALGAALLYTKYKGETLTETLKNMWEAVKPKWEAFVGWAVPKLTFMWKKIVGAWVWAKGMISPILNWLQKACITAFAGVTFVIKEWRLILRLAMVRAVYHIVQFANQVKYFFTVVIPATLKWFWENWRDIFTTIWNFTKTVIGNMWENIKNFFGNVWKWMKGEETDWQWTGLLEGFESTLKELPKIAEREITGLEKDMGVLIEKLNKDIGKKWKTHLGDYFEDVDKGKITIDFKGIWGWMKKLVTPKEKEEEEKKKKALPGMLGTEKRAGYTFIAVEELAKRIQAASISEKDIFEQQLHQLQEINKNLEKLPTQEEYDPLIGP